MPQQKPISIDYYIPGPLLVWENGRHKTTIEIILWCHPLTMEYEMLY